MSYQLEDHARTNITFYIYWPNFYSPLNATISSASVLQITAEHTESLVEGVLLKKTTKW